MTNEEAIKKDKKYLFEEFMGLIKDEFDERDEAYNLGVGECVDILNKCNFNNLSSVFQENTKLKAEIEQLKAELEQSVKLQIVLSKLLFGSEFARCYMCDNSMKNITLDGKNNGCDGGCYHEKNYTENDLIEKIKCEFDRIERRKQ